ncbi:MAG: hypothetical protein U1G08_01125 [Verrucomicrobiota bacterium]
MKSPRELILDRHQAATPDLDAIRSRALATLATAGVPARNETPGRIHAILEGIRWMRPWPRQLAALGCLWLLVSLLNRQSAPQLPAATAAVSPVTAHRIVSSIREYRRQISELMAPSSPPAAVPHAILPSRRRFPIEPSLPA